MSVPIETTPVSTPMLWAGRVMSALPALLMLMSALSKLAQAAAVTQGFGEFGLPRHLIIPLGILELTCTILYVIPRTAVLGAILLTGYMGGAILANVRIGEYWYIPALVGVFVWGGLFLRDPRIRALIPWRR
jgi:hypothetical protein